MKPILFNGEMVRAILDGRKTQTRRIIKGYGNDFHVSRLLGDWSLSGKPFIEDGVLYWLLQTDVDDARTFKIKLPYQVGDILYVRETWHKYLKRVGKSEDCSMQEFYGYKADGYKNSEDSEEPWRPSIHMPKEAARLFLKVTNIRVERLQDISEEDAKAEGIRSYTKDGEVFKYCVSDDSWLRGKGNDWSNMPRSAKEAFKLLWDGVYQNWDENPWVWVIEFERTNKPNG